MELFPVVLSSAALSSNCGAIKVGAEDTSEEKQTILACAGHGSGPLTSEEQDAGSHTERKFEYSYEDGTINWGNGVVWTKVHGNPHRILRCGLVW